MGYLLFLRLVWQVVLYKDQHKYGSYHVSWKLTWWLLGLQRYSQTIHFGIFIYKRLCFLWHTGFHLCVVYCADRPFISFLLISVEMSAFLAVQMTFKVSCITWEDGVIDEVGTSSDRVNGKLGFLPRISWNGKSLLSAQLKATFGEHCTLWMIRGYQGGYEMFVFRKIWRGLFSHYLRFEIRPFTLLPMILSIIVTNFWLFFSSILLLIGFCHNCSYADTMQSHILMKSLFANSPPLTIKIFYGNPYTEINLRRMAFMTIFFIIFRNEGDGR